MGMAKVQSWIFEFELEWLVHNRVESIGKNGTSISSRL